MDHELLLGNHLSATRHAPQVVTGVAVVLLNRDGMRLSNDVSFCRKHGCKCIPVVRIKEAVRQVLDLVVEPLEGLSITMACNPGHSSPCATIHGLDDPECVFFLPIKCHISSNSISWISPGTSGSGSRSASSLIQR